MCESNFKLKACINLFSCQLTKNHIPPLPHIYYPSHWPRSRKGCAKGWGHGSALLGRGHSGSGLYQVHAAAVEHSFCHFLVGESYFLFLNMNWHLLPTHQSSRTFVNFVNFWPISFNSMHEKNEFMYTQYEHFFLSCGHFFRPSTEVWIWQAPPKWSRDRPAGFASCRVYSHKPCAP